tara:strand:- start:4327 stop:4800 length:474 start_codon:yes stop_codon:yes gene_type:complete
MIEQIFTYFTIEVIYLWLNTGVLPFWIILIFFPQSKVCQILTTSIFPLFLFSIIYGYLIYWIFKNDYIFLDNFNLYKGLDNIQNLFSDSSFLILFWTHFLAINLFCGSWIVKDSNKYNITKGLIFFPLILTYFIGPIGIFVYWIIKIFFSKNISLYD